MFTILIISVIASIGVFCGWSAYLRRTSGPQDSSLVWQFVFQLWLLVSCFGIGFTLTPESIQNWLVIPLAAAGLFLIFRFRRQRRVVQRAERYLDPRVRDEFWIKKVQ
jgi:hypothetical protein